MDCYQFPAKDYAAETAHLSELEDLAYRRLLDLYHLSERPLPDSAASLARRIRMPQSEAMVSALVREFFTLTPDGWTHPDSDARARAALESSATENLRALELTVAAERRAQIDRDRVARARARNAKLAAALAAIGIAVPWNIKTTDLRALAAKHGIQPDGIACSAPVTEQVTEQKRNRSRTATNQEDRSGTDTEERPQINAQAVDSQKEIANQADSACNVTGSVTVTEQGQDCAVFIEGTSTKEVREERGGAGGEHTKPTPKKRSLMASAAQPEDVDASVWGDFLALRNKLRAPLTETALAGIRGEAAKAGWSLEDALRECCTRGWRGFKADWVSRRTAPGRQPSDWQARESQRANNIDALTGRATPRMQSGADDFIDV